MMIPSLLVGLLSVVAVPHDTSDARPSAAPVPVAVATVAQSGEPSHGGSSATRPSVLAMIARALDPEKGFATYTYLPPRFSNLSARRAPMAPMRMRGPVAGPLVRGFMADSLVVEKHQRRLTLFYLGRAVKSYRIALGQSPVGDKVRAGDNRTPEGLFYIDYRNPQSKYHLSLHISYPDIRHRDRALAEGVSPGGDVMIHGLPPQFSSYGSDHTQWDWTNGCVAVTDQEIEEIFRLDRKSVV